jgi:hypothetical protein
VILFAPRHSRIADLENQQTSGMSKKSPPLDPSERA